MPNLNEYRTKLFIEFSTNLQADEALKQDAENNDCEYNMFKQSDVDYFLLQEAWKRLSPTEQTWVVERALKTMVKHYEDVYAEVNE